MATARTTDAPKVDKPKQPESIGVKELSAHLGTDARALRAFLRRTQRSVGRGTRYSWPSLKSPELRKIEADWKAAHIGDLGAGR